MELSTDVQIGLSYLANGSHFSDDNYKKIVNSSLGLLAGEQNIERITTICPEKGDIVRKSYSSLLTLTLESIRFCAEEDIKTVLNKQNLKADRIDYFIKIFNLNRDCIANTLKSCSSNWPNLIDTNWRLDFVIKSNVQSHIGEPMYFVILSIAKEDNIDYLKFACNLHQLQDLCTKLKEIMGPCNNEDEQKIKEPWNMWELQPPPVCNVKTVLKETEVADMRNIVSDAISTLKNTTAFHKEAAFLSRYLYRFKRIFRHDKGVQYLVKVNQGLRRYLKLDLLSTLIKFRSCLPKKNCDLHQCYLPTQQMLKWVLLRIQSFAKIFLRIIDVSETAGKYTYAKLCLGWSVSYMLPALAMVSRVLVCSKFMLLKSSEWYNSLRRHLSDLKCTLEYLPNYHFPENFKSFVGDIDLKPPSKKTDIDKIFELIDLCDEESDDDVTITNEIFFQTIDSDNENDVEEVIIDETKTFESGKVNHKRKNSDLLTKSDFSLENTSAKVCKPEDLGTPIKRKRSNKNKNKKKKIKF